MVILNNHISDAMWCCNTDDGNGLWYNKNYSEDKFFDALIDLTKRYKDNPMVIGNDLRNEIRTDTEEDLIPTWGDNNVKTDWRLAAIKAGNLVLEQNPE